MYDILAYGFGGMLISTGVFCLAIAACVLVDRRLGRQRHKLLCWMCEKRPALPGGSECRRCRAVYKAATQERIAS